jgi:hypothetical protein
MARHPTDTPRHPASQTLSYDDAHGVDAWVVEYVPEAWWGAPRRGAPRRPPNSTQQLATVTENAAIGGVTRAEVHRWGGPPRDSQRDPYQGSEEDTTVAQFASDLLELLDVIRAGGDLDVVRRGVELVLQALIGLYAFE